MIFNEDGVLRVWAGFVLVAGWIGVFAAGPDIAGAYVDLARWVTGGQPGGMAVAGWLIYFTPGVLLMLIVPLMSRPPIERWTYLVLITALALVAVDVSLFPAGGNHGLTELVGGEGGSGFITGLRGGALAGTVTVFVVPPIVFNERLHRALDPDIRWLVIMAPIAVFLLATLVGAVVLAE